MPLAARRTFRLTLVVALALVGAYGLDMPLPYLAPLFAFLLTAPPGPPLRTKGLAGLVLVVAVTLGIGLLLVPVLAHYPASAVLVIGVGLYTSTIISIDLGKVLVGTLLTAGFTLIPAAGLVDYGLAVSVVQAFLTGIILAAFCQLLVYPAFPENPDEPEQARAGPGAVAANWIALRATLIVLPPVLLAFSNPSLYLPLIMKSVLLAQQGSAISARAAGRELLGSTFLAGCFAILFWLGLKICPSLWMFFLWTLVFVGLFAAKLYGVRPSRFGASFWQNVVITLLILLGPAVEDSAAGNDVIQAFLVRFSLFVFVTVYAWGAIAALEWLRRTVRRPGNPAEAV